MRSAILSLFLAALCLPCAADKLNHMCARTKSCGTPSPLVYVTPRLFCASALPWSAARRNHFSASASSCGTPLPLCVHEAEIVLRVGVALVSGEAIPLHGLGVVLRHPLAFEVHEAEIDTARRGRPGRRRGDTTSAPRRSSSHPPPLRT